MLWRYLSLQWSILQDRCSIVSVWKSDESLFLTSSSLKPNLMLVCLNIVTLLRLSIWYCLIQFADNVFLESTWILRFECITYSSPRLQLKNLSAMEVNRMRNFTVRALQSFYKHDSEDLVKLIPADDSQTSSAPSDRFPRVLIPPLLLPAFCFSVVTWHPLSCGTWENQQQCMINLMVSLFEEFACETRSLSTPR